MCIRDSLKAQLLEALHAGIPNRIAAEGREELDGLLEQPGHLDRNDRATAGGFLQGPQGMTNRSRAGKLIHRQKFHPLDMADHGHAQGGQG